MVLLRYMTILPQRNAELPDPAGPISSSLLSMAIEQANVAITLVRQDECKKGPYVMLSDEFTKG